MIKKLLFLLTFSLATSFEIIAQDDPCTATNATVGSSCVSTTYNLLGALTLTTTPAAPATCGGGIVDDAWLTFTAIASTTTVSYTNTSRDAGIWIYNGTCGALTYMTCVNGVVGLGTESITFGTTAGTVYWVRIGRLSGGANAQMNGNYCIYSSNNNCGGATSLTPGFSCVYTASSLAGATASAGAPAPSCSPTSADDDVWFSFVASATSHPISVQASASLDVGFQVLSGPCGTQVEINCTNAGGTGITENATVAGLTIGTTYYVRVYSIGTSVPPTLTFNICISGAPNPVGCPAQLGTLGTDYFSIGALAVNYSVVGQTTCGHANNITSANVSSVCGSSLYYGGLDDVYTFTPASSGQSTISVTSAGSWMGIMLYDGCPFTAGSSCVGAAQSSAGNQSMCVNLISGHVYYLIIDSWPAPNCNPYNLTITTPAGIPAGTTCAAPVVVASLPYSVTGESTACMGNDYTNLSIGSCGSLYESGEDKVYQFSVASATCLGITLTNASTTSIGYQVYSGCPGSAGTVCIGSNGGASGGTLSGSIVLPAAGSYYLIIDTWSTPFNCSYDLAISNIGSGPTNDLPCSASTITLGNYVSGDNNCSGNFGEPAVPACWSGGNVNSVWYKVVCPASGSLKIKTVLGSLTNTQIAVYSGACGPGLTYVNCNDNIAACGFSSSNESELTLVGLTVGTTYYIVVDGVSNLTGTFSLLVIDGSLSYPPLVGQDCIASNPVCVPTFQVANPGYAGFGNICDLPSSYCLASAERNVVWYTIPMNAAGNFIFDLVPNDFNPAIPDETDYDFAVWRTAGAGAVTCAQIQAGTAVPLACNYSGLGITGCNGAAALNANNSLSAAVCPMSPGYNANPAYNSAYAARIPVALNDVLVLAISNFAGSTSGFRIDFRTSPIGYTAATATTVTWSGGSNPITTLTTDPNNWGGCNVPNCGISAVIAAFANQPTISVNSSVNNLTIQAGATLTIAPGITLDICGSLVNNGNLVMGAGSTISFTTNATHNISGNLIGANKIWNLLVNMSGVGVVNLNTDMDVAGNFTTSNATSIFNVNGKYLTLAGNFNNSTGPTTFIGTAGSTVEFNGTAAQNYVPGGALILHHVTMNHTGTGVTIVGANNMVLDATGVLTLTAGKIITGALLVNVQNPAQTACTAGNSTSYVQGNLRRFLDGTLASSTYDFPVGEATKGYQRAKIDFTATHTIGNILAKFDVWAPIVNGPAASECPTNTYNVLNALDNGYWTLTANANPASGFYNASLYGLNYTNSGGAAGWTVMKATVIAGPWGLNGTCVSTSVPTLTQRTGMNGFSVFAIAQSVTPLPIQLVDFSGTAEADFNHLKWSTASENGNDYFTLERSTDGITFNELGRLNGAGNSTQLLNYYFNDMNPYEGTNYYRLKQTDFNGNYTNSAMVSIDFHRGKMSVNNIHPNPTNGELNFDFASPEETTIHYVITDMTGRVVADQYKDVKAGVTTIATLIADQSAGVYSLKIVEEKHGFISVSRIVKY